MKAFGAMRVGGLLLAGGQSRRMGGGDKCLLQLGGMTLLEHARNRLEPQVECIALNANGALERFDAFDLPILEDVVEGFAGPLAGVLTGMRWARENHPHLTHIATAPSDTPFFPRDVVARMCAAAMESSVPLACAASNGRTHPVFGLWDVRLADDLERALRDEGLRKIDIWTGRHGVAHAGYDVADFDPFFNINEPQDLLEAGALLQRLDAHG